MVRKSFSKISLVAIVLFSTLVFVVMGKGVAFVGKWGREFIGNNTQSTDNFGSVPGVFGANTEGNRQDIVIAFAVTRSSDDDDNDWS